MPSTTPVFGWRYPDPPDVPDGATQMKNLALDVEGTVNGIGGRTTTLETNAAKLDQSIYQAVIQTGTITGGPTNAAGYTTTVVFPRSFTVTPVVMTNLNSGSGSTNRFLTRASGVGVNGFTFQTMSGNDTVTTFSVPLQWFAVGMRAL